MIMAVVGLQLSQGIGHGSREMKQTGGRFRAIFPHDLRVIMPINAGMGKGLDFRCNTPRVIRPALHFSLKPGLIPVIGLTGARS